jgi:hypothetical protein
MQRAHRRWHIKIWTVMAFLFPVVLATSALLRARQSTADAPVRIDTPAKGTQR